MMPNELILPLVYVLMTNRTKYTYIEVLNQSFKSKPDIDPTSI